jgi:hypothetical protein
MVDHFGPGDSFPHEVLVSDIPFEKLNFVEDILEVFKASRRKVIYDPGLETSFYQALHQMGADESSTPGDKDGLIFGSGHSVIKEDGSPFAKGKGGTPEGIFPFFAKNCWKLSGVPFKRAAQRKGYKKRTAPQRHFNILKLECPGIGVW